MHRAVITPSNNPCYKERGYFSPLQPHLAVITPSYKAGQFISRLSVTLSVICPHSVDLTPPLAKIQPCGFTKRQHAPGRRATMGRWDYTTESLGVLELKNNSKTGKAKGVTKSGKKKIVRACGATAGRGRCMSAPFLILPRRKRLSQVQRTTAWETSRHRRRANHARKRQARMSPYPTAPASPCD